MTADPRRVKELFVAILELPDAQARQAFLERECGTDADLRQRLEALLKAHDDPASALDRPLAVVGPATADYHGPAEDVGTIIAGRYKLLEQIGEGGMGTVWVAEQTQPVRRKVALKLIKAGMDSKNVLSRFDAERQALALMDHPNIAKVLDGGTTETGRPFFVMEYVKGVPFTRYCDDARLSIAERLALFVPICHAVQHAHQKGIIHRDLKPSNLLICLYDGKPVPKVIDFGLAKAMHQPLTEHTLHTAHGAMMGTPLYMSPEQAEFNNLDVDTRTDIYALGVILYELLTGTTPLEKQRFQKAAWQEILRLIKEEEPPRPSARLSGSGSLPSLAAQRQLEPIKLTKLIRGELDWIVMKCLEKDRSRRYETANGLARDVERYLANELVEARPPTTGYRLRKLVRKHRVVISTAAAFAALLIVSAGISIVLAMKARKAEDAAENKRIEAEGIAEKAQHVSDQLLESIGENMKARYKTELHSAGLEVDLALGEMRQSNETVGLLQLVRFLTKNPIVVEYPFEAAWVSGKATALVNAGPEFDRLREFATMAVLASGQRFAALLPPITHNGFLVQYSSLGSKGDRLLTRAADQTARLWDPFTGRQIAILRRADEKVIKAGLSPDGATAFTHSLDGVIRLWETKDGAFVAQTQPRPERVQYFVAGKRIPFKGTENEFPDDVTELSNDRLLTKGAVWSEENENSGFWSYSGPVELWDAKSGRFIARCETPTPHMLDFWFFGNGRWLGVRGEEATIHVFSAEDGKPIAKLNFEKKYGSSIIPISLSPSGRTAAIVYMLNNDIYYVFGWDTKSWQMSSLTGPLHEPIKAFAAIQLNLLSDDLFAVHGELETGIYRFGIARRIVQLPGSWRRSTNEIVLLGPGQLFDTQTWRRLQPPKGRKYHPEISRFAPDGRFVPVTPPEGYNQFLDTTTEKVCDVGYGPSFYQANRGWVGGLVGSNYGDSVITLNRLPPPDRLNIPGDLLELWAQVAVQGQLDEQGAFVKWDEETWEKKRQELAAKPAPLPDFPFPGHVATDRLHWLRAEFENANDKDKSRLAKQLLTRADIAGDHAEATRWRRWLAANDKIPKP